MQRVVNCCVKMLRSFGVFNKSQNYDPLLVVFEDNLVLSTELIINRSDEGLTLETSVSESLYGGQHYIINSVDKTKSTCNTPTDAAPQFLL